MSTDFSTSSGQDQGKESGGGRRRRGGGREGQQRERESQRGDLIDKMIKIRRCAAVVKGGRRFSFGAFVVVGNGKGKVGLGYGKANEVPPSVEKAIKDGTRNMVDVQLSGKTIPHICEGRFGSSKVVLIPAGPGTGVIAGASVRAVCEAAGIHDILTKNYGSTNPANVIKAAIRALQSLRSRADIERLRGVTLS